MPLRTFEDIEKGTFAEACYDTNHIGELLDAIASRSAADTQECQQWELTPTEWRENMLLAVEAKIADLYRATAYQ